MLTINLTKHQSMSLLTGEITGYDIGSMPRGEEARICNWGAPNRKDWQVHRTSQGRDLGWSGHFPTEDEAFAELQRRIESERRNA